MNMLWKGYPVPLLLFVLTVGMMLGACGADSPTGTTIQTRAAGVVTAGTETAGLSTCMACHPVQTAAWQQTRHANLNSNPSSTSVSCSLCHNQLGDRTQLTPNRNVTGCESCHGFGGGDGSHVATGGAVPMGFTYMTSTVLGSVAVSAQFSTCTYCHEMLNSAGSLSAGPKTPGFHVTNSTLNILDTHYATSLSTYGMSTVPATGYAMDFNSETVCTNCHNPHGTADINRDWAQSLHADKGGLGAWARQNWARASSAHCQRCHTTSGYINFNDALRSGNKAKADDILFGRVTSTVDWNPVTNWKPEMLLCNACHTDNRGTIRNPGAFEMTYYWSSGSPPAMVIYGTADFQFPDVNTSNICVPCHVGRRNGDTVKNLNTGTTPTRDFGNLTLSDSHDFPTAAVMFRSIGYHYNGRSYEDPASYRHNQIGTAAVPNTGSNGPCVGCHMYRTGMSANHLFLPVSRSTITPGEIVNVSSEVCFNCHAGSSTGLAGVLESERLLLETTLTAFSEQLKAAGLLSSTGTVTNNFLSSGDTDWTGNNTGKNNAGATFNYKSLSVEPGAYVHNSKYVKRLIYDSIDWVDNRVLDYSTGNTLATSVTHSGMAWQLDTIRYLLPNGVRPFAPSERPY